MTGRTDVRAALLGGKTFRSLSEQRLSPREEKFEKARQTLGFFLAPAAAVTFALLPVPMDRTQQLLAAVLLGVIILWICEPVPIPVGGLLGVAAVVILDGFDDLLGRERGADVEPDRGMQPAIIEVRGSIPGEGMVMMPASLSTARRPMRWKSGTPRSFSNPAMVRDSEGWAINRCSAARLNLSWSTTARKYFSFRVSTPAPSLIRPGQPGP